MDVIDVVFYTNIYTSKKNCIILKINWHEITLLHFFHQVQDKQS